VRLSQDGTKTHFFIAELNQGFGPDTPEEAVWKQARERRLHNYMALRPDSFCEWSVKNRMEELSQEDAAEMMEYWYERAVDEQKAELRQYKKKKAQEPRVEPVPLTIEAVEEDLPRTGPRVDWGSGQSPSPLIGPHSSCHRVTVSG